MASQLEPGDGPRWVVDSEHRVPLDSSLGTMVAVPGSRMFEIRDALAVFRRDNPNGRTFDASQGDGGASLPGVPRELLDEAHRLQVEHGTGYDKPFGTEAFRRAVVEDYWQLESATGWGPTNVLACQGGRDGLVKVYDAVQHLGHGRRGDAVVTSRVPWISYNWGPYAVGANVMLAPGAESDAWQLTPEAIARCVDAAQADGGRRVALLVVTSPDNPTGRSLHLERQVELGQAAFAAGIPYVLFDWIYHRVTDGEGADLNRFLRAFDPADRNRVIILDGLTKSLGASNIRNAHVIASQEVTRFIQARASHGVIPSFHSQAVAIAAYRAGFGEAARSLIGPTNASRVVLRTALESAGLRHVIGDGYYAFIDLGPWIDRLGLDDSSAAGSRLAELHGLAVVPGVYFSAAGARWIRFSYALPPEETAAAAERLIEAVRS